MVVKEKNQVKTTSGYINVKRNVMVYCKTLMEKNKAKLNRNPVSHSDVYA